MSKLETNVIDTVSGTTNLTIGSTNSSTVTFENGSCTGHMYPAFFAYLGASQSVSNNVNTKIQFNTEIFDAGGYYDNSTNYRFTPLVAGKYFVYAACSCEAQTAGKNIVSQIRLLKNGSEYANPQPSFIEGSVTRFIVNLTTVVDMNGTTDYLECDGKINVGAGTGEFNHGSKQTYFGAYRLGD